MAKSMPLVRLKMVLPKQQMKIRSRENMRPSLMLTSMPTPFKTNFGHQEFSSQVMFYNVRHCLLIDNTPFDFSGFYFHLEGTFIGRLVGPVDMEHVSLDKPPFKYFIASLLLPCGPADGAVIKYTGNDNVGPLPKDPMTALLHAYTHFTYIYTNHQLLICDLQGKLPVTSDYTGIIKRNLLGLFDKNKALCLFDPQAHMSVLFITFQP